MNYVHVEYFNKDMEKVGEEDLSLDAYTLRLASTMSCDYLKILRNPGSTKQSPEYCAIRHRIFDICGSLQRMPRNLYCASNKKKCEEVV